MKWTPPSDAIEAAPQAWKPPADAVVSTPAPVKPEAPGWFQPGSKSEAAVRGFSQAATLGFGDEIQALVRGLTTGEGYTATRDAERQANANAVAAQPGAYMAGSIAGAAPSALVPVGVGAKALQARGAATAAKQVAAGLPAKAGLAKAAKQGAAIGATAGLGNAEGAAGEQLAGTMVGGVIGAAAAPAVLGTARLVRGGASKVAGTNLTNSRLPTAALAVEERRRRDATAGAIAGGAGAALTGGPVVESALGGAAAGYSGVPVTRIAQQTANVVRQTANKGGRAAAGATNATVLALQNMTGQQSREVVNQANQQVQQAVAAGQPDYAATFLALQTPQVRVAAQKVDEEEEDLFDDQPDEQ